MTSNHTDGEPRKYPIGASVEYTLTKRDDRIELATSIAGATPMITDLGAFDGGITKALRAHPDRLWIEDGITTINASDFDGEEILSLLTFGGECSEEDWDEWSDGEELDDYLDRIHSSDGFRVGRWRIQMGEDLVRVLTNGTRHIALSWPDAKSWDVPGLPVPWEPMFTWSFSNESGGPCIWDGSCEGGLIAPDALLEFERGDQDPGIRLSLIDPTAIQKVLAGIAGDWALPLLVGQSGLPGLTRQERDAVWGASPDNDQSFSFSCDPQLAQEAVRELLDGDSSLIEAQEALQHPESERGQVVYAWLRGFADSVPIKEQVDWFTIFDALTGEVGPPTALTEAELAERAAAKQRAAEQARRAAEEAQRAAHMRLRLEISQALAQEDHENEVAKRVQELADMAGSQQALSAARELLGLEPDQVVLYKHVKERISQNPNDESWALETWDAFWRIQKSYSAPNEQQLEQALRRAEKTQSDFQMQQIREQSDAAKRGWPDGWPWELCKVWRNRGGTMPSARAWAEAGYTAEEVLLGTPPTPEAMTDLPQRLRKRKPAARTTGTQGVEP